MNTFKFDLQIVTKEKNLPTKKDIEKWLQKASMLVPIPNENNEICIRITDDDESAQLNETYRHKKGPTNVLSFPYNDDKLLGDIVICAPLVAKQAKEQNKPLIAHYAHLIIHGYLHLLGYEHENDQQAKKMEYLETKILQELGFDNPYK